MHKVITLGILIIFMGCVVLFAGVITSMHKQGESCTTTVKTGGIILIGPIPIVFGTNRNVVIFSICGAILFLLTYLVWRSR